MSKTIINIKSLTINLPAGGSVGLPQGLIGAILARAAERSEETQPDTTGEGTAGTAGTTEEVAAAPVQATEAASPTSAYPTANDVLIFLNSDPRYTQRSLEAIAKHFNEVSDALLDHLLNELVNTGKIKTLRRRGDGATLYQALVHAAPVAAAPVVEGEATVAKELSVESVRAFIGSDARYTQRSYAAIAEHFGDTPELRDLLSEMVDDSDLGTTTRRRDSATLYQLA